MKRKSMKLRILLPTKILVDEETDKVIAEGGDGHFCLLPRHVDFVSALVPGILVYASPDGEERYVAVDEGVLVKAGGDVTVSTGNAVRGPGLGKLRETVEAEFRSRDERERKARSAIARIEADLYQRFMETSPGE